MSLSFAPAEMDFKTRFQGKMSHITKDGSIDNVIMSTDKMMPIGKTPAQGFQGGIQSTPLGSNNERQTPNSFDEINVGLSYQSSVPIS